MGQFGDEQYYDPTTSAPITSSQAEKWQINGIPVLIKAYGASFYRISGEYAHTFFDNGSCIEIVQTIHSNPPVLRTVNATVYFVDQTTQEYTKHGAHVRLGVEGHGPVRCPPRSYIQIVSPQPFD